MVSTTVLGNTEEYYCQLFRSPFWTNRAAYESLMQTLPKKKTNPKP